MNGKIEIPYCNNITSKVKPIIVIPSESAMVSLVSLALRQWHLRCRWAVRVLVVLGFHPTAEHHPGVLGLGGSGPAGGADNAFPTVAQPAWTRQFVAVWSLMNYAWCLWMLKIVSNVPLDCFECVRRRLQEGVGISSIFRNNFGDGRSADRWCGLVWICHSADFLSWQTLGVCMTDLNCFMLIAYQSSMSGF